MFLLCGLREKAAAATRPRAVQHALACSKEVHLFYLRTLVFAVDTSGNDSGNVIQFLMFQECGILSALMLAHCLTDDT